MLARSAASHEGYKDNPNARAVRFIRKNGRVIPIKAKDASAGHDRKIPEKMMAAGAGTTFSAGAYLGGLNGYRAARNPLASKIARDKFASTYKNELVKHGFDVLYHANPGKHLDITSMSRTSSKLFRQKRPFIAVSHLADEGIFAHELGHAIMSKAKGSFNYAHRRNYINFVRGKKQGNFIKKATSYIGMMNPISRIGLETEATVKGFNILRSRYGFKNAVSKSKLVLLGQATYWGSAAFAAGLTLYGAKKIRNYVKNKNSNSEGYKNGR